ncbi:putative protein cornichon [Blattamonas nauphoetae]|uniref:Cornichon n=1 Tax=Blattamonas nauphoetae TaxID=2049346 RepID=A0ABQ9Y9G7_9EUKA|nr:putative protein cornichon [Blattamonas nauphoetae]
MTTVFPIIMEGITFFIFLLICFYDLYAITSLGDLESDIIASKDLCDTLNPFFYPVLGAHIAGSFLSILSRRPLAFILTIPGIVYYVYKIINHRQKLDFTQIRRADELHRELRQHYFLLAYYVVLFLLFIVLFLVDLVHLFQ